VGKRLLIVRAGRQPHEIFICLTTFVVGLIGTTIPQKIGAPISAIFGGLPTRLFYLGMAIFSAVVLYSLLHRKIESMLLERVGLVSLSFFYLAYAVAVYAYRGIGGLVSAILPIAFVLGNIARIWQIGRDLSIIKSYLNEHPEDTYDFHEHPETDTR
jgi:hypothetical protein